MVDNNIKYIVENVLVKHRLSIHELCDAAIVSKQTVYRILQGGKVSHETAYRILKLYCYLCKDD